MTRKMIICKECGLKKPHAAFGLCNACYKKQNLIICKECGKKKPYYAKGLCKNCYQKQNLIICKKCRRLKPHQAKGLCITCYQHKTGRYQPSNKNKSCALYLGLMAEKLLSKVFKDVERMPNGNIGFDFKCSKGMKIDVKSSVLIFNKNSINHKGNWHFNINKNTIADYFLCIAFNNRKDKNPLHLWLIPSKKVNHLQTLSISKTTIHKWSQYEKSLDKTIECCNSMKNVI